MAATCQILHTILLGAETVTNGVEWAEGQSPDISQFAWLFFPLKIKGRIDFASMTWNQIVGNITVKCMCIYNLPFVLISNVHFKFFQ